MITHPNGVREWTLLNGWAGASLGLLVFSVWAGPVTVLVGRRGGRLVWRSLEVHCGDK